MNILSIIGIGISLAVIAYNGFDWRTIPLGLAIAILLAASLLPMGLNSSPPTWLNRTAIAVVLILVTFSTMALLAFPNIAMPKPRGTHQVGTTLLSTDEVTLRLWYPASPNAATKQYRYLSDVTHSTSLVPQFIYGHLKGRVTETLDNAPVKPSATPYPVVFYMHGADSFPEDNTFRQMELASHGYVVVAVHPQKPFAAYRIDPNLAYEPATFAATLARDIVPDQVKDMGAAVKTVFALSTNENSPLDAKLFQSRFGVLGYSLGGSVAAQFCATHPDCGVVINLDGNAFGPVGKSGLTVPYLHLNQSTLFPDAAAKALPDIMQQTADHYAAEVSQIVRLTAGKAPAQWFTLKGSGHASFTDLALWTPMRLGLFGTLFGNSNAEVTQRIIDDLTISFLDQFLSGKAFFETTVTTHADHLKPMAPHMRTPE